MPALAPAALAISVVLSALGAVVLCALVVLYGFTPAGEEPPGTAARRLLLTRIGHAVAAVCFTATAILIAIVLAQPPRPAALPAAPAAARVPVLDARLKDQEARLAGTEARLRDLEGSLRREAARPEPAPPAPVVETPAPKRPAPSARVAPPARVAPKQPAASSTPLVRVEPPPVLVIPAAPAASPRTAAPAPPPPAPVVIVEPAPGAAVTPAPPAVDVEVAALGTHAVRAPAVAPVSVPPSRPAAVGATPATPPPATPPPAASSGFELRRKLREDWSAIRRGIESGERDFWRAVDETKRNFRSLVD